MRVVATRETAHFAVINGEQCYVGPERRKDRRRSNCNRRLESLLNDFGLDRRIRTERRRKSTSWLIMHEAS
ncbi:hypothetical protein [Pleionea sp. CnH1-48]|uniref:hypothetical protein n=1 Tax=Pleionea sp. CnH1-48 TaxID=2954494 RepID=UPI002097998C|nr:hypothetical protein [Pleionea sp. CnH1-48]MCO7226757.1 hypothetical protein [Pleionea sp. CnH1-48]